MRVIAGSVLLLSGAVLSLPGIPGPGVAVMVLGLSILAVDFEFARRWLTRLKELARRASDRLRKKGPAV